jgi:hypothetical protein
MDDYEWKKTIVTCALLLLVMIGGLIFVFMNDA